MNESLRISTWYYVGSLLDVLTTVVGVFGLGAEELNPIVRAMGWGPAFAAKMLLIPVAGYCLVRMFETAAEQNHPGAATYLRLSWLFPIGQGAAVAWNVVQIAILAGRVVV